MKAIIKNINEDKFSLNGLEYYKTFIPVATGTTNIRVVNIYDSRFKLIESIIFSEIEIDGITYANQKDAIEAISNILYRIPTGAKGDPFTYEDFTPAQLDDLRTIEGAGIIYDTLAAAQAVTPAPANGTIFQVSEITDPTNAGYYSFQSTEAGGTRFEREFLELTDKIEPSDKAIASSAVKQFKDQFNEFFKEEGWVEKSEFTLDGLGSTVLYGSTSISAWGFPIGNTSNITKIGVKAANGSTPPTQARIVVKENNKNGVVLHDSTHNVNPVSSSYLQFELGETINPDGINLWVEVRANDFIGIFKLDPAQKFTEAEGYPAPVWSTSKDINTSELTSGGGAWYDIDTQITYNQPDLKFTKKTEEGIQEVVNNTPLTLPEGVNTAVKVSDELFSLDTKESDFIPIFSDGTGPQGGTYTGIAFSIGVHNNLKRIKIHLYLNSTYSSEFPTKFVAKVKKIDKEGEILAISNEIPLTSFNSKQPFEVEFNEPISNPYNDRLFLEVFADGKFGLYRRYPNPDEIFTEANGYPPYAVTSSSDALTTGELNYASAYRDFYFETVTLIPKVLLTTEGVELFGEGQTLEVPITNNLRISLTGSSVTWGDGFLQSGYVGELIKRMQTQVASSILPHQVNGGEVIQNRMYFGGEAKKITGINSEIEFNITGDEVSIIQSIERSNNNASEIEVLIDGEVYDTINNYNPTEMGSGSKSYTGDGESMMFDLNTAFTYNHQVSVNGVNKVVVMNMGGFGFTIPSNADCALIRRIGNLADGTVGVTHWLWFKETPASGAAINISFDYGENLFYEKTTIGQDAAGNNESSYGDGNKSFDTTQPSATSSGLDFRQTDSRVVKIYRFTESKTRNVKLRIKGNYNNATGTPYFIFNFATNRFFHFQNAGIGGWDLWDLDKELSSDYLRGWQRVSEFNPDILLIETTPNDDWKVKGHKVYHTENMTLNELRTVRTLPIRSIQYDSGTDTYDYSRWAGIITAITETSVTFSGTVDIPIVPGDILMVGNYYADGKEYVERVISSVDGNTVSFLNPVRNGEHIYSSLQSFVGNEMRVRSYDIFSNKLETLLGKFYEVLPDVKLGVIPNPLPNIQGRELWGYPTLLSKMAKQHGFQAINCAYFQTWQDSQKKNEVVIPASELTTDSLTGYKVLEFGATRESIFSPDVIVDGVSVYGNDAVIETGWAYVVDKTKTGSELNKASSGITNAYQVLGDKPRLIFKQNAPTSGNITVRFSKNKWSNDSCHMNTEFGPKLYADLLLKEFIR